MLILGATLTERTTRVGLARKLLRSSELLNAGTNIIAFEMELASRQNSRYDDSGTPPCPRKILNHKERRTHKSSVGFSFPREEKVEGNEWGMEISRSSSRPRSCLPSRSVFFPPLRQADEGP